MPRTVVVVEDNADEAVMINRAVSKAAPDVTLVIKNSGTEAIEYLQECRPKPALMLLDLKMPGMDGLAVLRNLRSADRTRYIPVVMLTSSALQSDIDAAYRAGANGFVTKAQDLAVFTRDVKTVIEYWRDTNRPPQ
jgi:two-component system response regulator